MKAILAFLLMLVFARSNAQQNYPYALYTMAFDSQSLGLRMAYMYEKAENPNGHTVLLLHGKNFNGIYWGQTMEALLGAGYDVLVPDQLGFGQSSLPDNYQYSFQQLALNTKLLCDTLDVPKVIVVGHSMGGMLAIRFALLFPETCQQLILENPIGLEDWKRRVPYTTIEEEYVKELRKTKESLKDYMLSNYFHNTWKDAYNTLLDNSSRYLEQANVKAVAWTMALTSDMLFTQPVYYELDQIRVPTVLVIGQADRTAIGRDRVDSATAATLGNYPELGRQAAARIARSKLVELPGIGHIPHVEDFGQFRTVLLQQLLR